MSSKEASSPNVRRDSGRGERCCQLYATNTTEQLEHSELSQSQSQLERYPKSPGGSASMHFPRFLCVKNIEDEQQGGF